jgi:L-cysteine S-thiosulfotransferase
MKIVWFSILFLGCVSVTYASPEADLQQLSQYYQQLFPTLKQADYAQGVYALDPIAKQSWLAIEEFPPYEPAIERGEYFFKTPFKNHKNYAACFLNQGIGIAHLYPMWDAKIGEVQTLSAAINECRVKNGEHALDTEAGELVDILAYMTFTSRGKTITVNLPNDIRAIAAYEAGKSYYYQRRGQLNFACSTCHIDNAGKRLRAEVLSPLVGQGAAFPVYRLKWGEMGTLQRRIRECHQQIRAEVPNAQSAVLRNVEYFLTFMAKGIPMIAPSTRK